MSSNQAVRELLFVEKLAIGGGGGGGGVAFTLKKYYKRLSIAHNIDVRVRGINPYRQNDV